MLCKVNLFSCSAIDQSLGRANFYVMPARIQLWACGLYFGFIFSLLIGAVVEHDATTLIALVCFDSLVELLPAL